MIDFTGMCGGWRLMIGDIMTGSATRDPRDGRGTPRRQIHP
jgi:hypothetical protein